MQVLPALLFVLCTSSIRHSKVLSIVLVEGGDHVIVVLLDVLNIPADAVHSLLDVVVSLEDAVLELEAARVAVAGEHVVELVEDLFTLVLAAEHDLLKVGVRVLNVLVFEAVL